MNSATLAQVRKLKDLEAGSEAGGDFENYTKKEQLMMSRQRDKLSKNLSGIKNLNRLPGLMFVIDSKKERIAVAEAASSTISNQYRPSVFMTSAMPLMPMPPMPTK